MHLTQLEAFGVTLAVESIGAIALAPAFAIKRKDAVLAALIGSTMTHPQVWLWFYPLYDRLGALTTPAIEAAVIIAEAPFYRYLAGALWTEAFLLSLLINAASWWAGEAIYALL